MTLIEHYLKKYFNLNERETIKEIENYLINNGYTLDLNKTKDNNIIYLTSKNKKCTIKKVIFDKNDEEIIINEEGIILDDNSPYNGYNLIRDINIVLNNKNMCIIEHFIDPSNVFNKKGYSANTYYLDGIISGELIYPMYESIKLEEINSILDEIKDNNLILTIMGKITNKALLKYQVKKKIVKQL